MSFSLVMSRFRRIRVLNTEFSDAYPGSVSRLPQGTQGAGGERILTGKTVFQLIAQPKEEAAAEDRG